MAHEKDEGLASALVQGAVDAAVGEVSHREGGGEGGGEAQSPERADGDVDGPPMRQQRSSIGASKQDQLLQDLEEVYQALGEDASAEERILAANRVMQGRRLPPKHAHLMRNLHTQPPRGNLLRVVVWEQRDTKCLWADVDGVMRRIRRGKHGPVEAGSPPALEHLHPSKRRVFLDEHTHQAWFAQPWYFNIFHNPLKNTKLLSFDRDTHPLGMGSSEIMVRSKFVSATINKDVCELGSYNFRDRPTVGWRQHWAADVVPCLVYRKKVGK